MEILISGKQFAIDQELREVAESAAVKLTANEFKLSSLRLVLTTQRNWQIAEAVLNGKNISLVAKARSNDIKISIVSVIEKLEKQLRRYIERIKDLATKADPVAKNKIWTSAELSEEEDDLDLFEDDFE